MFNYRHKTNIWLPEKITAILKPTAVLFNFMADISKHISDYDAWYDFKIECHKDSSAGSEVNKLGDDNGSISVLQVQVFLFFIKITSVIPRNQRKI
jgi:hypothetical protein